MNIRSSVPDLCALPLEQHAYELNLPHACEQLKAARVGAAGTSGHQPRPTVADHALLASSFRRASGVNACTCLRPPLSPCRAPERSTPLIWPGQRLFRNSVAGARSNQANEIGGLRKPLPSGHAERL